MDPLLVPYCFNILVLVPVGLLTLLGGAAGNRWVFHGKFPEMQGYARSWDHCGRRSWRDLVWACTFQCPCRLCC